MRVPAWLSDRFESAGGLHFGLLGIPLAVPAPHLPSVSGNPSPVDRLPFAATPPDAAFLRLVDEASSGSQAAELAAVGPEIATPVIVGIGLIIAVLAPTWYWLGRPAFLRGVSRPKEP